MYVGHSGDEKGLFLGVLADTVPKTHSNWRLILLAMVL